jgi:hypothetical protein
MAKKRPTKKRTEKKFGSKPEKKSRLPELEVQYNQLMALTQDSQTPLIRENARVLAERMVQFKTGEIKAEGKSDNRHPDENHSGVSSNDTEQSNDTERRQNANSSRDRCGSQAVGNRIETSSVKVFVAISCYKVCRLSSSIR